MANTIKVKIINKSGLELPCYATECSAGFDLLSASEEDIQLNPLERKLIPTRLYLQLPESYEAQVRPRSGLALKHGITVLNSPGTIDSDYRGEVGIILVNLSDKAYTIKRGDRIAQMVIARHEKAHLLEVETLDETSRGSGGFGSTGKN